ncbi:MULTISPECIES: hypothetical protein [unclassified Sphingomonas]|uniref:hypothetical protein n=1 Tax=unclassified Sphingomonas TaxID=196159 RepID=UPI001AD1069D|nr:MULTISPECIES: hypothetical protein [unclassified Sphingomonas]MBN8846513.1 hypothetical protein [Sphingomonas sp.]
MNLDRDRAYHTRRAYQEAVRAIRTLSADAEASHDELCRMHCRRFIAAMGSIGGIPAAA